MILASIQSMPRARIPEDCSSGACSTKREHFHTRRRRRDRTTANHTTLPPTLEDCLPLTGPGLRNWDGTILVSGSGEEKTLSCPSKFGCVVEGVFGFHVVEYLMSTEATPAPPVVQEPLHGSFKEFPQL